MCIRDRYKTYIHTCDSAPPAAAAAAAAAAPSAAAAAAAAARVSSMNRGCNHTMRRTRVRAREVTRLSISQKQDATKQNNKPTHFLQHAESAAADTAGGALIP